MSVDYAQMLIKNKIDEYRSFVYELTGFIERYFLLAASDLPLVN
jgi:hypothetical protein